jgi:Repeats of unknown function (DUF5649)
VLALVGTASVDMIGLGNDVGTITAGSATVQIDGLCYRDEDALVVGNTTGVQFVSGAGAEPFAGTFGPAVSVSGINSAKHVLLISTPMTVTNDIIANTVNGGHDIIIDTGSNGLTLTGVNLNAGTNGDIGLWAGGAVVQTGGALLSSGLQLGGAGSFDLQSAANNFATLSAGANTATPATQTSAPASMTLVSSSGTGITVSDLTLTCCTITRSTAGVNVTGLASMKADAGNITQQAGKNVVVGSLEALTPAGSVILGNAGNVLPSVAAVASGGVTLTSSGAMAVAAVDGTPGIQAGTGAVVLSSTALTQTAAIVSKTGGLAVLGSGAAVIGNAGNDIAKYAANTTGSLTITDTKDVVIGDAGGVNGITANALTINAAGKNITQTQAVVAPTATFNNGAGNVTLTNAGNDFGNVIAPTAGKLALADANSISVAGVAASQIDVAAAGGNVTITSPGTVNMGVISGQKVNITADVNITDANGQANNITATVDTTLIAQTGTIVTEPAQGPFRGINTPILNAFAGGVTKTTNDGTASIDVWGQVGTDTINVIGNPPGSVWLNGRRIGVQPSGVIAHALQADMNSPGQVVMNNALNRADLQNEGSFPTDSPRVILENAPAAGAGPTPGLINISGPGISLPPGVSPQNAGGAGGLGASSGAPILTLQPGGAPMNLPNGAVASMAANGDVLITLPSGAGAGGAGGAGLGGLSAVTITPTDSGFVAMGRTPGGAISGVEGGVEGNAQLKALLDQIADFLPEEYRRKWGLRAKASDAAGIKVSQL